MSQSPMLTIGQLADFADVTIRAVRHYHTRGLLPEPDRDESGYRRYDATAAVRLIRIKTLAQAGVPLSRVSDLLDADADTFADAVAGIDRDLDRKINELRTHRRRVAKLAAGDELALGDDVVEYLHRLREIGISDRLVDIERDGWILLTAHTPERVSEWITEKRALLDDERFRDLYRRVDECFDWDPDDPRLVEIVDALADFARTLPPPEVEPAVQELGETLVGLLDAQMVDASPAWQALGRVVETRDHVGWTPAKSAELAPE